MRVELAGIHKALGNTIIYVTHDQTEAMTLGDRIVVMNQGAVQQIFSSTKCFFSFQKKDFQTKESVK